MTLSDMADWEIQKLDEQVREWRVWIMHDDQWAVRWDSRAESIGRVLLDRRAAARTVGAEAEVEVEESF